MVMNTPQDEAIHILSELINDLTQPESDLKSILRRCQHICQLLDWTKQLEWFDRELNGYLQEIDRPDYRQIPGKLIWEPEGSKYDIIEWETEEGIYGHESNDLDEELATLDVWSGIDFIVNSVNIGYKALTDETKISHLRSGKQIKLRRVRSFPAVNFSWCLSAINRYAFDFASRAYTQLKYGSAIQDIWYEYRSNVEAKLIELGFHHHLNEIHNGLLEDNPEAWRSAVYECRSLLSDVANYLWRDQRSTYDHLPGGSSKGNLSVTEDKFANRIYAYLHQKGISGKQRKFMREEITRLAGSIRSLIGYQSKAHQPIQKEDARTIALSTYFLLGELVLKTDMKPIEEYGKPSIPDLRTNEENNNISSE